MSDYKKAAADRRDARNTRSDVRAPSKGRGSKRDFCKGKKGVLHTPKCVDYNDVKNPLTYAIDWKLLLCTVCGKELDFYIPPFRAFGKPKPVPAWVIK